MTRTDYKLIARKLHNILELAEAGYADVKTVHKIAETFASEFALMNPPFNKNTFMRACGFVPVSKGF